MTVWYRNNGLRLTGVTGHRDSGLKWCAITGAQGSLRGSPVRAREKQA